MAGKADVQEHLIVRRNTLNDFFADWAEPTLDGDSRADLVERYCKHLRIGEVRRPSARTVYVAADNLGSSSPHVLVLGRHDVDDLRAPQPQPAVPGLSGPGVASRVGPTIGFAEGFLAAQTVTNEPPITMSILSLGEGDTFSSIAPALFLGHIDAVIITSAANWNATHPTITTGCRGELVAELSLSGGVGADDFLTSGALRNPLTTMMQILGELRDERGRIDLPGFYDRAQAPDPALRSAWLANDHDPNAWARGLGAAAPTGRLSSLERASLWPGVSVLSVEAVDADGFATPSSVKAALALYLVPDQRHAEAEAALRKWFLDRSPSDLSPHINVRNASRPYRAAPDSAVVAAQARAAYRLYGRKPVLVPAGGPSGSGEVAFATGAPVAFAGMAPPSLGYGTSAEAVPWEQFDAAVEMAAETLLQLRRT